jgi:GT2 family glycosyltransferase
MFLTVAICTWNRAAMLDRVLARMRELQIPAGLDWELLVVNNNSTDPTDEVIDSHLKALPVRRLHEAKPGLSNARNCAVENAGGELLVWTDDDVLVDPGWLAAYATAATAYPAAGYFGGTVVPWFEQPPPRWVARNLDLLHGPFALRDFGPETRPFTGTEAPYGANMAFRTADLKATGFDSRLGRTGAGMLSGEETAVIERLKADGRPGVWVGGAIVRHHIPAARMTPDYVWRFFHGLGRTRQRLTPYDRDVALLAGAPRWVWRQYLLAAAAAAVAAPARSRWWLKKWIDAAGCRGILDECRRREPAAALQ